MSVALAVAFFYFLTTYSGGAGSFKAEATSIARYLSEPDLLLRIFGVGAVLCLVTLFSQRHQADRYSTWVMLATVLGLFGGVVGVTAMQEIFIEGIENYPKELTALSVGTLLLCALVAFTGLVWMVVTKSPQRGRMISVYLVVWAGFFGSIQKVYILDGHGVAFPEDGIELATAETSLLLPTPDLWSAYPRLDIDADGVIKSNGSVLSQETRERLPALLAGVAMHLPRQPWRTLLIRADGRAPWRSIVDVASMSAMPEADVLCLVFYLTAERTPHREWSTFTCTIVNTRTEQRSPEFAEEEFLFLRIELRTGAHGEAPVWTLGATTTSDLGVLLLALNEARSGERRQERITLIAPPDTQWQTMARFISWLNDEAQTTVGALELRE